jgi:hypothetical protein
MWYKYLIIFFIHLTLHEISKISHVVFKIVVVIKFVWLFILNFLKLLFFHFDLFFKMFVLRLFQMLFLLFFKKLRKHIFCCVLCGPLRSLKSHFIIVVFFILIIIKLIFFKILFFLIIFKFIQTSII